MTFSANGKEIVVRLLAVLLAGAVIGSERPFDLPLPSLCPVRSTGGYDTCSSSASPRPVI